MASLRSEQWDRVVAQRLKDCKFSEEDRQLLSNSTTQDVEQELQDARKKHDDSSKSLAVFKKLDPFIKLFNTFADFAAQLASLDPHGVASLVIGSLRITIKVRSYVLEAPLV